MRALSLLVFLALAGSATAAVLSGGQEPAAQASPIAADGSFSFANSGDGMPIFSATGIGPGDSLSGTVEIANSGALPGELVLTQHDVTDAPGLGGASLSARLSMRIADVTAPANPIALYTGPLAPMPPRPAGLLDPGESRTYEFVAMLPEAGSAPGAAAQNDVQGASTSVAYSWTASEPRPVVNPEPTPGQPPSSSSPGEAGSPPPTTAPLRVTITRVRPAIRHGRLLIWARCDTACSIAVRGRLRARSVSGHRGAKLRPSHRRGYREGTQRLPIRIPRRLQRWLAANPDRSHLTARVALLARDPAGNQAAARRALRVRSASRSAVVRGSGFKR